MKGKLLASAVCVAAMTSTGCLYSSQSKVEYEGRYVSETRMLDIAAGAGQSDVLAAFGEPTAKSELGDGAEQWSWRYTRKSESSSAVFLLFGSQHEEVEHGTVYVRFESGRVAKVWRTDT